jgi:mannose-6-phosphate isomerase-like protein (cupin superfamily)
MHDLAKTFAVLAPGLALTPVDVTPDIYERLDRDFDAFRGHVLVAMHAFDADWPTWERHPAGDELVLLLAGAATFVLDTPRGAEEVVLAKPGGFVIVPRNTWHTARVAEHAEMLFITPGEGTENEVRP